MILFLVLIILVLAVLAVASSAPVATAGGRTYCRCVQVGGERCYRCCDFTGCYDLYCGQVLTGPA
jgi:hypothetical protein